MWKMPRSQTPPKCGIFHIFFFLKGSLRLFQPGIFVNPWITLISSFNARGVNNERMTPTVLSGVQQPVAVRWPAANIHIAISCYPPPLSPSARSQGYKECRVEESLNGARLRQQGGDQPVHCQWSCPQPQLSDNNVNTDTVCAVHIYCPHRYPGSAQSRSVLDK